MLTDARATGVQQQHGHSVVVWREGCGCWRRRCFGGSNMLGVHTTCAGRQPRRLAQPPAGRCMAAMLALFVYNRGSVCATEGGSAASRMIACWCLWYRLLRCVHTSTTRIGNWVDQSVLSLLCLLHRSWCTYLVCMGDLSWGCQQRRFLAHVAL
jgi:hypothetical protein